MKKNMKRVCKQEYEINPLTGRCVKKCKEGFKRNPVTGRCKKIPVLKFCKKGYEKNLNTKKCIKKCKSHLKRNTLTGRCKKIPNITPPLSKKTSKKTKSPTVSKKTSKKTKSPTVSKKTSKKTTSPTVSECRGGYKKNLYTGICRQFINAPSTVKLQFGNADSLVDDMFCGIDDKVLEYILVDSDLFSQEFIDDVKNNMTVGETKCEAITKHFPKQFVNKITGLFGMGSFGIVFASTEPNGERIAVKVSNINEDDENLTEDKLNEEVRMSKKFSDLGVGLEIKKFGIVHIKNSGKDLHGFIKMERVNGNVEQLLEAKVWNKSEIHEIVSKVFDIIKKISDNNLFHGDLHLSNIGFIIDSYGELQLKLIDFGRSGERSAPRGDAALLIRSGYDIRNTFVRKTFIGFAYDLIEKMFRVRLRIPSEMSIEGKQEMLFDYALEKLGLDPPRI